jgi:myo-inositol-1(or 4)-monophosphatase
VTRADSHRTGSLLLAAERAVDVGASLMRRGRAHVGALIEKRDRDYATMVDVAIEGVIADALASVTPAIPLLGEEHGGAPNPSEPFWVLDPIDGTINFSRESPLCGIALALIEEMRPVLGVVDLPLLGERFVGCEGLGAYLNGRRVALASTAAIEKAMVGFSDLAPGIQEENRIHLAAMERLATRALRVLLDWRIRNAVSERERQDLARIVREGRVVLGT